MLKKLFTKFLQSFILIFSILYSSHDDKLDSEGMQVLVEFSLVRGNLGGIFKVLRLLYGTYIIVGYGLVFFIPY